MAELPEVVVTEASDRAQLLGVGAVIVVEANTGGPRALVFDLQIDVHGAGALTFAHQRHHLSARGFVELCEFALNLGEVRYLAFFQRRDVVANIQRRIVFGADHTHPADLGFADLQVDDAVGHRLLRQLDEHRLIATLLIGLLQGVPRAFDIREGFCGPRNGYTASSIARASSTVLPRTKYSLTSTRRCAAALLAASSANAGCAPAVTSSQPHSASRDLKIGSTLPLNSR